MMAQVRDSARTYGKSDPIDAPAVAHAELREPHLPTAHLDGPAREVRLLAGHRDDLVAERTRIINHLRWHPHELGPSWEPAAHSLWRQTNLIAITGRLTELDGLVAQLSRTHVERCRELTAQIRELDRNLEPLVIRLAPTLVALCGCATRTAAKIIGETAGIERFRSRHAVARRNGTEPVPVWSSNRVAITQAHYRPQARESLDRRRATGDTKSESIRVLKRRLSEVAYRALLANIDRSDALTATAATTAALHRSKRTPMRSDPSLDHSAPTTRSATTAV